VVSGGGTGIGLAVAAGLRDDGLDVVLLGRRTEVLDRAVRSLDGKAPGSVTALRCDAGDPDDVQRCADALAERYPAVDVVVANAGAPASRPGASAFLAEVASSWVDAYRANVLSAVLLTTAHEPLLPQPGGRVVLVGSKAATTGGSTPAYVAAKAALNGWVLSLAARLGPQRRHGQCRRARLHRRDRASRRSHPAGAARRAADRDRRRAGCHDRRGCRSRQVPGQPVGGVRQRAGGRGRRRRAARRLTPPSRRRHAPRGRGEQRLVAFLPGDAQRKGRDHPGLTLAP